jgi:hypothetical protein
MALWTESEKEYFCGYMTKRELIEKAQYYCDTSLTLVEAERFHTGWTSMKTLIEKNLVIKERSSINTHYSLSMKGENLARKLQMASSQRPSMIRTASKSDSSFYHDITHCHSILTTMEEEESCSDRQQNVSTLTAINIQEKQSKIPMFLFEFLTTQGQITSHCERAYTRLKGNVMLYVIEEFIVGRYLLCIYFCR